MKLLSGTTFFAASGGDIHWAAMFLVVFACLQTAILLLAAWYAYGQLDVAKRDRDEQDRPFVIGYVELSRIAHSLVELVIENIGRLPAHDVKITFNPNLRSTIFGPNFEQVNEWSALKNGISFLAPGQRMTHLLDSLISRYAADSDFPRLYELTIKYKGGTRARVFTETITLDLGVFYGAHYMTEHTVHDVAGHLEEIAKVLGKWSNSDGLKVYGVDYEVSEEQKKERYERAMESRKGDPPPSSDGAVGDETIPT